MLVASLRRTRDLSMLHPPWKCPRWLRGQERVKPSNVYVARRCLCRVASRAAQRPQATTRVVVGSKARAHGARRGSSTCAQRCASVCCRQPTTPSSPPGRLGDPADGCPRHDCMAGRQGVRCPTTRSPPHAHGRPSCAERASGQPRRCRPRSPTPGTPCGRHACVPGFGRAVRRTGGGRSPWRGTARRGAARQATHTCVRSSTVWPALPGAVWAVRDRGVATAVSHRDNAPAWSHGAWVPAERARCSLRVPLT